MSFFFVRSRFFFLLSERLKRTREDKRDSKACGLAPPQTYFFRGGTSGVYKRWPRAAVLIVDIMFRRSAECVGANAINYQRTVIPPRANFAVGCKPITRLMSECNDPAPAVLCVDFLELHDSLDALVRVSP